jgi:integrase
MKNSKPPYKPARLVVPKNDSQRWYVIFYVFNQKTLKFQRVRDYTVNKFKTQKERKEFAKLFIQRINEKLRDGAIIGPVSYNRKNASEKILQTVHNIYSVESAVELALNHKKSRSGERGIQAYTSVSKIFLEWCETKKIHTWSVALISQKEVSDFFDYLLTERKVTAKTHNNYKTFLVSLFNVLIEKEIIKENPFSKVKKLKEVNLGKNIAFNSSQVKELKEYMQAQDGFLLLFCEMMFYTFMRPNEIRQIQLKHVDLQGKRIFIPALNSKSKKAAAVYLPDVLAEKLKQYIHEVQDTEYYLFSKNETPDKYILPEDHMSKRFKQVLKTLNYSEEYTFYSWKHTGVVHAYKSGIDIKSIQKQLRHSSIEITDIYLKSLGLEENTAMEKMPEL